MSKTRINDKPRKWRIILERDCKERDFNGHRILLCSYCKGRFDRDKLSLDHVIPKSAGGTDAVFNLVISCKSCNNKKGGATRKQIEELISSSGQEKIKEIWNRIEKSKETKEAPPLKIKLGEIMLKEEALKNG